MIEQWDRANKAFQHCALGEGVEDLWDQGKQASRWSWRECGAG